MHRSVAGSKLRFSVAHASGEVRLLTSHSAGRSDAQSCLEPLLAVFGGAISPWPVICRSRPNAATRSSPNPNQRVLSRVQSVKVNRALHTDPRALASGRLGARLESAHATRDDPGTESPRVPPLTDPHPPLAAASRSSRPVRARRNERLERARNTHPTRRKSFPFPKRRIPTTPRASSTSTPPRRAGGNARASLRSRRSSCSGWTIPPGSTRSSF